MINQKNNAVIIGAGVIGKATGKALGINDFFDIRKGCGNLTQKEVYLFKYLFVCVPTPSTSSGCNLSYVENVFKKFGKDHIYIIRSTVPPGTAEFLMKKYDCLVVNNPEFLTEKTANKDAKKPDIIVIGCNKKEVAKDIVKRFYSKKKFSKSELTITNNITAEMIKYSINTFYATKVIFANYLYQICRQKRIDYETVKKTMYKRKWIGNNHLTVPYENQFGVRGKCLPKDLIAFSKYSKSPFFLKMVKFMKEVND